MRQPPMTTAIDQKLHRHTGLDVVIPDSPFISERLKKSFEVGNYEINEAKAMIELLKGGERILELGGGVGVVSAAIGKAKKIEAHHIVEADARLVPVMKETHRLNGVSGAEIHNCIVTSDKDQIAAGSVKFALAPSYTANSIKAVGIGRKEVEVPVVSLKDMVERAKPNVLICDIEGAEVDLLTGADLSMFNLALVELHPPIIGPDGTQAVIDAMHVNGLIYDPEKSHGIFVVFKRPNVSAAPTIRTPVAAENNNYECNVCGGKSFSDFRNRQKVRCDSCQTLERSRLLQFIFDKEGLIKPGHKVLHLAPEVGIARNIKKIVGNGYDAIDLNPKLFPDDLSVRQFDLAKDVELLPKEEYDIVLHSHVMEHIPCDITSVLWHLHRSMKQTGMHVFCIPMLPGKYEADFGPISREHKTARFGQFDHVRKFGMADLDMTIGKVFNLNPYDASKILTPELAERHRIPMAITVGMNSNTFFVQDKRSLLLQ